MSRLWLSARTPQAPNGHIIPATITSANDKDMKSPSVDDT